MAAQVAAERPAAALSAAEQTLKAAGAKAESGYELAFNIACAATTAGQLDSAQHFLDLADRLGQETLIDEGASQEVRCRLCWVFDVFAHTLCYASQRTYSMQAAQDLAS